MRESELSMVKYGLFQGFIYILQLRDIATIRACTLRRTVLLIMDNVMDEEDSVCIRFRAHEAIVAAALCELECGQLNTPFLNQLTL